VERGGPDPGVGIVGHRYELGHRVGVDEVVEETTAALTDGRILVTETSTDRAHRVLVAPQQLVIGRDGTLGVAQARDEGLVVGPDESEHDFSLQPYGESRQRDYESGQARAITTRAPRHSRNASRHVSVLSKVRVCGDRRDFSWAALVLLIFPLPLTSSPERPHAGIMGA